MKQASTLTYYAIARKDWNLVSAEKYLTIEEAKAEIWAYYNSTNDVDYRGKIVILKIEEISIWGENGYIMKDVRTTLVGA